MGINRANKTKKKKRSCKMCKPHKMKVTSPRYTGKKGAKLKTAIKEVKEYNCYQRD